MSYQRKHAMAMREISPHRDPVFSCASHLNRNGLRPIQLGSQGGPGAIDQTPRPPGRPAGRTTDPEANRAGLSALSGRPAVVRRQHARVNGRFRASPQVKLAAMAFNVSIPPPAGAPAGTQDTQFNFDSSCRYEVLGGTLKVVQGATIRVWGAGFWRIVSSPDGQEPEA